MSDISPELYLELENATPPKHSRRTFLKALGYVGAGLGAAYTGLRLDSQLGDAIYGDEPPEVHLLEDSDAAKQFPHHFNVVGGGFGVFNVQELASHVHNGLREFGQTAYIKNSNGGLHEGAQEEALLAFLEEHGGEVVTLYGHSMDGMVMTEIGRSLLRNGVEVQAVLLDCTPERKYDVRPGKLAGAEFLASVDRATEVLQIDNGVGVRAAFEGISRVCQGRTDYDKIVEEALAKITPNNCSDRLLKKQANYICSFNGAEQGQDYPIGTKIGKLRPADWNADQTTNNRTALVGWRSDAFPHLTVDDVAVMGGAHANPGNQEAHYATTLVRYGRERGFYQPHASKSNNHPI
jgi:pimeloyl-ACP methyl ester carboxylesterase